MPAADGVLWSVPLASDEKVELCKRMGEPALAAHCTAVLTARAGRWALLPGWVFWQAARRVWNGWTPDEAYAAAVRLLVAAGRGPVLVPDLRRPEPPPPQRLYGGLTMSELQRVVFGAA